MDATLDITNPVSRPDYILAVTGMHDVLENTLKHRNSWCDERFRYFTAVIPDLDWDGYPQHPELNFDKLPEDADYAERLRDMRGKLLWYTKAEVITLDEVNEIFAAAKLPEYGTKKNAGTRVNVLLPRFEVSLATGDLEEARGSIVNNFAEFLTRMLDGGQAKDDDKYVPGSFVLSRELTWSSVAPVPVPRHGDIPTSDTVRPSYT
jgi:hypothetical protein